MKGLGFNVKDVIYISLIAVGLFFGYRMYKDLTAKVEDQKIAYAQLAENIARSSSEFVTKSDLNKFGEKISGSFTLMQDDIKKLGGEVVSVGQTIAQLEAHVEANQSSDAVEEITGEEGTIVIEHFKKIKNKEGLPLSWAKFKLGSEQPWTTGTYPLEFHINTVLGLTKDDKVIPEHELVVYNTGDPEVKDKPFKVKITSSIFKQIKPKTMTFFWWAPHLDFGINMGANLLSGEAIFGLDLGFAAMAYGRTKNDNIWRFARASVGTRDKFSDFQFTLSPLGYNLGSSLPLISDVWIWPTLSFGFGDTYGIGATVGTTF